MQTDERLLSSPIRRRIPECVAFAKCDLHSRLVNPQVVHHHAAADAANVFGLVTPSPVGVAIE